MSKVLSIFKNGMKIKFFLLLLIPLESECQLLFTHYFSSPLSLNPANASNNIPNYQIGGIYRNELDAYSLPSTKSAFFLTKRILVSQFSENDILGIGFEGISEKNTSNGIKNSYLSTSLSYQKSLDEEGDHTLGIGFQTSFSHKKIEPPSLIFEDQLRTWAAAGFTGLSPFQNQIVDINYIDFNVGLNYNKRIGNSNKIHIGTTISHVNAPQINFNGGTFFLNKSFTYQIDWEHTFLTKNKINVGFIKKSITKNQDDFILSFLYLKKIKDKTSFITIGSIYRNNSIYGIFFSPTISFITTKFSINLLNDIDISTKAGGKRGALELSMIYKDLKFTKKANKSNRNP